MSQQMHDWYAAKPGTKLLGDDTGSTPMPGMGWFVTLSNRRAARVMPAGPLPLSDLLDPGQGPIAKKVLAQV
jgi:hypothetical protein